MFNLIPWGHEAGDGTSRYAVNFHFGDPLPTVGEFIDYICTNHSEDWGNITVRSAEGSENSLGSSAFVTSYKYGSCDKMPIPASILSKQITSVKASGGYTRMDYFIEL